MVVLGIEIKKPSSKDLHLAMGIVLGMALTATALHQVYGLSLVALRSVVFVLSCAALLGPFGISFGQQGWRVMPVFIIVGLIGAVML